MVRQQNQTLNQLAEMIQDLRASMHTWISHFQPPTPSPNLVGPPDQKHKDGPALPHATRWLSQSTNNAGCEDMEMAIHPDPIPQQQGVNTSSKSAQMLDIGCNPYYNEESLQETLIPSVQLQVHGMIHVTWSKSVQLTIQPTFTHGNFPHDTQPNRYIGNMMGIPKCPATTWIYFQNVNGISLQPPSTWDSTCSHLRDMEVDIALVAEHKLDTSQPKATKYLYDGAQKIFGLSTFIITANSTPLRSPSLYKPGGVLSLLHSPIKGCILTLGHDPLVDGSSTSLAAIWVLQSWSSQHIK